MTEPAKKKYKNNFLIQVICQLRFASDGSITEEALVAYKKALGADYGELATIKQQGIIIENTGSEVKSHTEDSNVWQIESTDKSHVITVTPESLALMHTSYTKFREYVETVKKVHELFFGQFTSINEVSRLGLRYVNKIAPKGLEHGWSEYIAPELTAALDFVDPSKLRRSMHSMSIQHDKDIKLNFNYGIFNEYFPAPVTQNEFILDIDAFTDSPFELEVSDQLIEKFNTVIAVYFEKSISDPLRSEMEVIEDAQ